MYRLLIIVSLFFIAGITGCNGTLYDDLHPPYDECFRGEYSNEYFSLYMTYNSGTVVTSVTKEATSDAPWEGMSFSGKIVETGQAEGVLTLNFDDNTRWVSFSYSIYLDPPSGDCNTRNQLTFPRISYDYNSETYTFSHTLTRQP